MRTHAAFLCGLSLAAATALGGSAPAVSPSYGTLALAHGRTVTLSDLDGGRARVVYRSHSTVTSLALAPDRRHVLVTVSSSGSTIVDNAGSPPRAVPGRTFVDSWSNDGRRVVTDGSRGRLCGAARSQLYLDVSTSSGGLLRRIAVLPHATRHAREESIDDAAFSPDGTKIAYVVRDWGCDRNDIPATVVGVADVGTGRSRLVFRGRRTETAFDYAGFPAWSPDGTTLALPDDCQVDDGCTRLLAVNVADGRQTVLHRNADFGIASVVLWAPRGDTLYVAGDPDGLGAPLAAGSLPAHGGRFHWLFEAPESAGCLVDFAWPTFRLSADATRLITDSGAGGCTIRAVTHVIRVDGGGGAAFVTSAGDALDVRAG